MKRFLILTACFSLISSLVFGADTTNSQEGKWERCDRVVAVVNNRPVIESVFNRRIESFSKNKTKESLSNSRVLDVFINEIILDQAAEAQAIQITDERIDNDIKKIMDRYDIHDLATFRKKVETEQGLPYDEFRQEIRKQALTEQLMMIAVDFNPPSIKDEKEWYEKNKQQLVEIRMKHILIKTKGSGFAAEKAANEKIKEIQRQLLSGQSFDDLARKESEDPGSAAKGGDLGWSMLGELDPYFANQVMQSYSPGGMSGIIKSSYGYHIVKFYEKRLASFQEMEDKISNMLGNMKRSGQFEKWLLNARKSAEIRVYLEGYKPPQG